LLSQVRKKNKIRASGGTFAADKMNASMKTRIPFLLFVIAFAAGCSQGQNKNVLAPQAFADKLKATTESTLIDVRTPGEFSEGHLAGAKNFDWNGEHFEHQVMDLDKSKPVFVYCLKGGRSASAAAKLRDIGFKEVYELEGGTANWQAAKLPLTKD
jgi:rhodanese-related sulfurtransferase